MLTYFKSLTNLKKENKLNLWQPIETAPSNQLLVVGFDSYDCGWCYETASYCPKRDKWVYDMESSEEAFSHRQYSHWFIPTKNNLKWTHVDSGINDQIVIFADFKNIKDFKIAWNSLDEVQLKYWSNINHNGNSKDKGFIKEDHKYKYFAKIPNLKLSTSFL